MESKCAVIQRYRQLQSLTKSSNVFPKRILKVSGPCVETLCVLYKKYHKCGNVGMKKELKLNNNFCLMDYFVILQRRITQYQASKNPGHRLLV